MRAAWAVLGGLALGAGIAWWQSSPGVRDAPAGAEAATAAPADAGVVYRWTDAAGVTQITRAPPEGRPYARVVIDPNRNVVPAPPGTQAPSE